MCNSGIARVVGKRKPEGRIILREATLCKFQRAVRAGLYINIRSESRTSLSPAESPQGLLSRFHKSYIFSYSLLDFVALTKHSIKYGLHQEQRQCHGTTKKRERTPRPSPVTMLLEPFTVMPSGPLFVLATPVIMPVSSICSLSLLNRLDDLLRLRMVVILDQGENTRHGSQRR
jgi:hypothetical protein